MKLIGNIFVDLGRDKPAAWRWRRIGAMGFNNARAVELRLRGYILGDWMCKPDDQTAPVFLQGDLLSRYVDTKQKSKSQWCGRVFTAQEHDHETIYYGSLRVIPCKAFQDDMAILTVKHDELDTVATGA